MVNENERHPVGGGGSATHAHAMHREPARRSASETHSQGGGVPPSKPVGGPASGSTRSVVRAQPARSATDAARATSLMPRRVGQPAAHAKAGQSFDPPRVYSASSCRLPSAWRATKHTRRSPSPASKW